MRLRGIEKCFADIRGLDPADVIRAMVNSGGGVPRRQPRRVQGSVGPAAATHRLPEPVLRGRQVRPRRPPRSPTLGGRTASSRHSGPTNAHCDSATHRSGGFPGQQMRPWSSERIRSAVRFCRIFRQTCAIVSSCPTEPEQSRYPPPHTPTDEHLEGDPRARSERTPAVAN